MKTERVRVYVDCQMLGGGILKPVRVYWTDGRAFDVRKTLDFHPVGSDCAEICYTVLIGSVKRNLYRVGSEWYVKPTPKGERKKRGQDEQNLSLH